MLRRLASWEAILNQGTASNTSGPALADNLVLNCLRVWDCTWRCLECVWNTLQRDVKRLKLKTVFDGCSFINNCLSRTAFQVTQQWLSCANTTK